MAHLIQCASASIHPSVFTPREAGIINKALSLIESKRLLNRPVLNYFEDFERYLVLRFAGLTNEQFHVLYLNIDRELLSAETEFFGDQSSVRTFDIRKVALRAITLGAEYVVFAHNHPNDNPTPSDNDVGQMDWTGRALKQLNIGLLDSYVVTSSGITSIKKHHQCAEEMRSRELIARLDKERLEKQAKRIANKAAKFAAQLQGASA